VSSVVRFLSDLKGQGIPPRNLYEVPVAVFQHATSCSVRSNLLLDNRLLPLGTNRPGFSSLQVAFLLEVGLTDAVFAHGMEHVLSATTEQYVPIQHYSNELLSCCQNTRAEYADGASTCTLRASMTENLHVEFRPSSMRT
jgi:hypothetical protein